MILGDLSLLLYDIFRICGDVGGGDWKAYDKREDFSAI